MLTRLLRSISLFLQGFFQGFKGKSTNILELRELENIYGLLLVGSFIGIPSPPTTVSLRVFPYMVRELEVMARRAEGLDDVLGDLLGAIDIT